MEKVFIDKHHPKSTIVYIEAGEEGGRLQLTMCDGYERISLFDDEIWWVFEELHYLYNKVKGDF